MMNPYPIHPGFSRRVFFAENALRLCAEGNDRLTAKATGEAYSRVHSREMDACFQNYDGKAVIWELMRRGKSDPVPMRGIKMMCGNGLDDWRTVAAYRGPQMDLAL